MRPNELWQVAAVGPKLLQLAGTYCTAKVSSYISPDRAFVHEGKHLSYFSLVTGTNKTHNLWVS